MAYIGKTKENFYHFDSSKASFKVAKELRKHQTNAESILWDALRNRQVNGVKFRRQHPVCSFIADFYCHEAQLVIEVDGSMHNQPEVHERDKMRETVFKEHELRIIRFTNDELLNDLNYVIQKIKEAIT